MRNCCLCKSPDRIQVVQPNCNCAGGDVTGHSEGCKALEHHVKKDIRFQQGPLSAQQKKQGWTERDMFQGKQAIQRLLCTACIRKQDEVTEIEQFKKKCGEEAEGSKELNMYQILCT